MDEKTAEFSRAAERSFKCGTLKSLVFSSPAGGDVIRIRADLVNISGKVLLQAEYFMTEGRVKQKNLDLSELEGFTEESCDAFRRAELYDTSGTCQLLKSKKGKTTLLCRGKIGGGEAAALRENNREKQYILSGGEGFLCLLDIADKNGRVYDKKQSKFRQINKFLEHLRDVMKYLPENGTLYVNDLCCGKSYLSFAVYYYLTELCGRSVSMTCVDLKKSVLEYCENTAKLCGFEGMSFVCADINEYNPETPPQLVISLHACDTATDAVLDKAAAMGAEVILSTPCCHRELSRQLNCPELAFVSRHSILKSKLCDAATDALRILRLEALGYSCTAAELIDPEETPKNVLIRAVKKKGLDYKGASLASAAEKYRQAYKYLTSKEAPDLPEIQNG